MRIRSLRVFLITTIISTLFISTITTIVWSYYTINHVTNIFDILLVDTANNIRIFLKCKQLQHLEKIQQDFSQLDASGTKLITRDKKLLHISNNILWAEQFTENYESEAVFQIWEIKPEKMLLHSAYAPLEKFANFEAGFKDVFYKDNIYRVYTQINPELNLIIQTAQNYKMRDRLANTIIKERIYPLIFVTPILLFIIFLVIKVAADSLKKISNSIKIRDPKNLSPLDEKLAPREIRPLLKEINRLFSLINDSFAREQRFNADAAHELKTPLAAIKIQAEVIKSIYLKNIDPEKTNAQTEQIISDLDHIIMAVNRSNHVVSQLLILSKLSPNQPIKELTDCYLDRIIRGEIAALINHEKNKKVEISFDIVNLFQKDIVDIPSIKGNETLLKVLIKNILENSIKYTTNTLSKIKVKLTINKQSITLEVSDNGPGIPEHLKQRVFDRFYRIPGTEAEGSGLGLSIVKLIAVLHNAQITLLDNQSNTTGLTILIVFPF